MSNILHNLDLLRPARHQVEHRIDIHCFNAHVIIITRRDKQWRFPRNRRVDQLICYLRTRPDFREVVGVIEAYSFRKD